MQSNQEASSDPRVHMTHVRRMMNDLATHLQEDEEMVQEPQALALFETSREVLKGLMTAIDHYTEKTEKAFQR